MVKEHLEYRLLVIGYSGNMGIEDSSELGVRLPAGRQGARSKMIIDRDATEVKK
jgi:hypothetical protein